MGQRRSYSKEFKLEAVNLVLSRGVNIAQACRDLDVAENVWVDGCGSTGGARTRRFLVMGCKSLMTRRSVGCVEK
jgi:transposase